MCGFIEVGTAGIAFHLANVCQLCQVALPTFNSNHIALLLFKILQLMSIYQPNCLFILWDNSHV